MQIVSFRNSNLTSFKGIDASYDDVQKYKKDYIHFLASYEPNNRFAKVSKNVSKAMFLIPLVDTAATFLIKKGPLTTKLKSSALSAMIWSTAFVASGIVNSAGKKISNIKFFDDFNDKHPKVSSLAKFVSMYGVFTAFLGYMPKLKNQVFAKYPNRVAEFKQKVIAPLKQALNDSSINSKIIKPLNLLADKYPMMTKNLRIAAKLVAPVIFFSSIFRFANEAKNRNENIANNIAILNALDKLNTATKV